MTDVVSPGHGGRQNQMADHLRKSEERLRQVVESTPNAIVMINRAGLIEMVNMQAERLFGYPRQELVGYPVDMLVPERFRAHHPDQRASFYADPEARPMGSGRDLYGLRKDGSEFPVEIGLNPIETDEGMMVLSAIVDISERKRSEQRFRQVVESMPNAILTINPVGLIEMVNMQAERMFGYSRSELIGRPIQALLPSRFRTHHPSLRADFFADLKSRAIGAGQDLHGLRKDGSEFPVEVGLNPITTEEGHLGLFTIVDISDRKENEERIRALREKDVMLGEIHHRVKNNLQVIDSLLELQSARIADPTVLSMLRDSQNRIRSMALIHRTLYESKDFVEVNFAQFLDTLAPVLISSYGIEPERIKFLIDTTTVVLPISSAIPCGLLVNEMMSNALKHAFPDARGGTIELRLTSDEEGYVVLSFTDDGVGIPAEFDLDNPTTLGLQLIPLLADQLHGTLRIDRANPTRFVLRFPNLR